MSWSPACALQPPCCRACCWLRCNPPPSAAARDPADAAFGGFLDQPDIDIAHILAFYDDGAITARLISHYAIAPPDFDTGLGTVGSIELDIDHGVATGGTAFLDVSPCQATPTSRWRSARRSSRAGGAAELLFDDGLEASS